MSQPDQGQLQDTWRKLARRYDWSLVDDEAAFLGTAAAERDALGVKDLSSDSDRIAVWRAYSALLYRGLWRREERAAAELWSMSVRMAIKDGRSRAEAEELAQEVVARSLEKLPRIRSPHSTLSYVIAIVRTVLRERSKAPTAEQPIETDDDEPDHEPADPSNIAEEVERRLTHWALAEQLRAKLANDLELTTIVRIVLLGDNPRDVARDLGLPLHRTRVAKCRALARLRQDPAFMSQLGEYLDQMPSQETQIGADDDDT